MCQKALNNQTFENLKSASKLEDISKLGFSEQGGYKNFFRQGKVNSAKSELSIETIEFIESKSLSIYEQAKDLELLG